MGGCLVDVCEVGGGKTREGRSPTFAVFFDLLPLLWKNAARPPFYHWFEAKTG